MFNRRTALLAAALFAAAPAVAMAQPAPQVQVSAPRKAKKGLFGGWSYQPDMIYGKKGAGISMATQKRASIKAKKNVNRANRRRTCPPTTRKTTRKLSSSPWSC